ncbi:hypothetical protein [Pseudonocardia acidicola]|uniref:Uncharacterized protein n=1 Tax=Pseudonocardia acidicola TaxID=2724939 RepID=A0ABX1SGG3_9PSEU|nr:hypothetical protein [Pseudonocardia acidicola]NMH99573.1 hypothetical protein [Pseudonocardia acidicola]
MSALDVAALRKLAAAKQDAPGPCNRRCRERGECAFGRSDPPGTYCRERRPPRRGEWAARAVEADRS